MICAGDFQAVPDRWRVGLPRWKRIADTTGTDSPYEPGRLTDPYAQNVLKGDYPILGQNVFFVFTAISDTLFESRRLPTPSGVSTAEARRADFFGSGDQRFGNTNLLLSFEQCTVTGVIARRILAPVRGQLARMGAVQRRRLP